MTSLPSALSAVRLRRAILGASLLAASIAAPAALTAPVAGAAQAPNCTLSQLKVQAGTSSGALGSILSEFSFVNTSSQTCSLSGYPKLQMLGGPGAQIPTSDSHAAHGFDGVSNKPVTLAKGQHAWFGVEYPDETGYGNLKCPRSTELSFTPPNVSGSLTLTGKGAQIEPYGGSIPHLHCGDVMITPVSAKPLISE